MQIFPILLLPIVIFTTTILIVVLNKLGSKTAILNSNNGEYRFGTGIRYFVYVSTIIAFLIPGIAALLGVRPPLLFTWIKLSGVFTIFLCIGDICVTRYVVYLISDRFIYGWVKTRECYYRDVISLHLLISNQGNSYFIIKTKNGSTIRLDGNLQRFDELVGTLKSLVLSFNPSAKIV